MSHLNKNGKIKLAICALLFSPLLFVFQACGPVFKVKVFEFSSFSSQSEIITKSCGATYNPGHAMIHRLSNNEYNNTVRDLLYTGLTPANNFQSSSIGSTGFSNESVALTISNQMIADYAGAAEKLAAEVLASKGQAQGAYTKLVACSTNSAPSADCIRMTIRNLAERAFRHPLAASDIDALQVVWNGGGNFDQGLNDLIISLLIDPRFIFLTGNHPEAQVAGAPYPLDAYEFATRLSYFIWQSMPDAALMTAAADGSLNQAAGLKAQIERMLKDPKAKALATTLRREWANLSQLDSPTLPAGIDAATMSSIKQETQAFIEDMIQNDLSLMTLINGSHTFVNKSLAAFYGWNVPAATSESFIKIQNPQAERKGVLGHAGLLMIHGGNGTYTHPVQRGRFVADSMFCEPPPPPPAGIPTIDGAAIEGATMRERLLQHTSNASCIGCHKVMDTVGLGLENFDMNGRFRTNYSNALQSPIDASGQLAGGDFFQGPAGLIDSIAGQPKVKSCLVRKLMSLAVARSMTSPEDRCTASAVGIETVTENSKLSDVIFQIAQSLQFRLNTGENR